MSNLAKGVSLVLVAMNSFISAKNNRIVAQSTELSTSNDLNWIEALNLAW